MFSDIFYDVAGKPLDEKVRILRDAYEICSEWWVDVLDNTSIRRKKTEMNFEEALKKCDDDSLFCFIHRRGQSNWYFEIGFRTMTRIDYMLWILVKEDNIQKIIEKYELKPMN